MSDNVLSRGELLNKFRPQALKAAEFMRNLWHGYKRAGHPVWAGRGQNMDFKNLSDEVVTGQAPLHRPAHFTTANTWASTEAMRFWFNPWCYVEFFDLRPKAGAKARVNAAPAEIISKHTVGAGRTTLKHDADGEGTLTHTFTREDEAENVQELAVTASAEFRQLIKAGSEAAGFESETELTVALETVAKQVRRQLTRIGLSVDYAEPVVGRTKRYVEWLVEMGQYRQSVTIDGELDYGIRFWSQGDFTYTWLSRDEFIGCINGVGDGAAASREGRDNAAAVFNRYLPKLTPGVMADTEIDSIARPLDARVVLVREFERAYDQTFSVRDEPL